MDMAGSKSLKPAIMSLQSSNAQNVNRSTWSDLSHFDGLVNRGIIDIFEFSDVS